MYNFKKLDKLIDTFEQLGIPSVDISVYHRGSEVYRRMGGYSDVARTKPIDGSERYNIYSCSKPITVTAALQLLEAGKYSLDDELSRYLPEFGEASVWECGVRRPVCGEITIRDLFTMSAGFTYNLWSENLKLARTETNGKCPTREVMRYLAKDALAFDPGRQYSYSLCHDVLAALVEVISGESFNDYVTKHIFEVAGMESSTYLPTSEEEASLCAQYRYDSEKREYISIGGANGYRIGSEYASGGAGCVSTVDDYVRFLEALRTYKLLKPETVALMTTNQLDLRRLMQFDPYKRGYGYGLGVRCELDNSGSTDFGWGGAAGAYLAVDIPHEFTVYHAQHVLGSPNQELRNYISFYIREALR